jgi:hypothetical protein
VDFRTVLPHFKNGKKIDFKVGPSVLCTAFSHAFFTNNSCSPLLCRYVFKMIYKTLVKLAELVERFGKNRILSDFFFNRNPGRNEREITKEQKQDLMHVATCRFANGYYD